MHKKTIIALAIAGMVALVAQTTFGQQPQIIELKIGNAQAVHLTHDGITSIGYIDVPAPGRWLVSGGANFWEIGETGTTFVGANASVGSITLPTDGSTMFQSAALPRPTNINLSVTIPPHILRVGNDPRVYFVIWSNMPHQPPPNAYVWGCLFAQRIGD